VSDSDRDAACSINLLEWRIIQETMSRLYALYKKISCYKP
jgi:hypothetical protein